MSRPRVFTGSTLALSVELTKLLGRGAELLLAENRCNGLQLPDDDDLATLLWLISQGRRLRSSSTREDSRGAGQPPASCGDMLDVNEAARALGVTPGRVTQRARAGEFPGAIKNDLDQWRIPRSTIEAKAGR